MKRAVDVCGALLGLALLAPLLLVIAATIRLSSPGPALFRQPRIGYRGRRFEILKFRTMYSAVGDEAGTKQACIDDERVTPVGKFLREKSLDELPQLLNVLTGEMSLVGPRPHVPGMQAGGIQYDQLVPYYGLRHQMRPGITGWAQANGYRGPTEDPEFAKGRIEHDMAYLQNFSLWLDLRAILKTCANEILGGTGT